MKLITCLYLFIFILVIFLLSSVIAIPNNRTAMGVIHVRTQVNSNSSTSTTGVNMSTFTATGTISSLLVPVSDSHSKSTKYNITSPEGKFVLAGDWILSVNKGNLSYFAATFIGAAADGSPGSHTHQVTNFKVTSAQKTINLTKPDHSIYVKGTVDVAINGIMRWHNAHATISISNGTIFTLVLNNKETGYHFGGQPIYALVDHIFG